MRRLLSSFAALLLPAVLTLPATASATPTGGNRECPVVARPRVAGARILSVSAVGRPGRALAVPPGPGHPAAGGVPAVCDVTVVLTHPGLGDRVRVQVWLPRASWNGRFLATGGGAFAAGEFERRLAPAVRDGYAAASTDAGVRTRRSAPPAWALRHDGTINEGLLTNFADRSVHEMSQIGEQVTTRFYGRPAAYSYFNGCSTGGRQGLMEAQRHPADFDGILAASPAINWDRLSVAQFWPQVVMNETGVYPTACEFDAFNRAAIAACAGADGVIGRPEHCRYDPGGLVGRTVVCHGRTVRISQATADVVRKIWDGPRTRSGRQLWYGLPRGAPFTWLAATAKAPFGKRHGAPFPVAEDWIRYFLKQQPGFDTSSIGYPEFEQLFQQSRARYDASIGTDAPDLSAFRAAGGKMITWHGLADRVVFPGGTVDYRRRVEADMGGAHATDEFYRVFLAPGADHCSGGTGPVPTDPLGALVDWVEHGHAPDTLPAATTDAQRRKITRDLCRYPETARQGCR
jgi:feruloyl esterase